MIMLRAITRKPAMITFDSISIWDVLQKVAAFVPSASNIIDSHHSLSPDPDRYLYWLYAYPENKEEKLEQILEMKNSKESKNMI